MNEQSPKEEVVDKKKEKELKKREEKERKEREKREKADREKAKKEEEKRKKEEEKRRKDMEKAEKPASPKKAESAPAPVAHTPHSGKTIRATAVLLDGEKHEVELEVNSESNMYFPVYDNGSGSLCCFCHPYPHP